MASKYSRNNSWWLYVALIVFAFVTYWMVAKIPCSFYEESEFPTRVPGKCLHFKEGGDE